MLDFTHPCGLHGSPTSLSNTLCTCEALVQPLPSLLLVLVALAGGACALLCSTPTPPPKQLFLRSKSLHIGGIVFALFGAVAALTSVALPLLVPADWPEGDDGSMLPVAWLLSPLIEFVAACVAAVILAHTRQSRHPRARSSWRILVGVAALLQAVTTIVVMMLTVMAASSFVLILTLVRVGTNCALALTALWPNSPGSSVGSSESGGWGSPDEPSPHAREAAAALLRQVDAAAADATAHRRSQRDVWAEWLTLSSSQMSGMAQQPACTRPANVMTEGSVASTFHSRDVSRITHDSDQRDSGIHYTIGMDSASERNTDYSHAASCCPSPHASRAPTQTGGYGADRWAPVGGGCTVSPERIVKSPTRPTAEGLPEDPFAEHSAPSAAASVWAANGGHRASDARDASGPGDERWTEPLVEVEIVGHVWVPDLENPGKGDLHLEYMLKTALVTSREQAIPLGEALRAEGFITPNNPADTARFADNASLYRFVEPATM